MGRFSAFVGVFGAGTFIGILVGCVFGLGIGATLWSGTATSPTIPFVATAVTTSQVISLGIGTATARPLVATSQAGTGSAAASPTGQPGASATSTAAAASPTRVAPAAG